MKIAQLEYFCAVCQYHSITQAAQKLYVTQPAISSAVKELEKEFSVSLFSRTKNSLTLTTEGEQFYRKAAALLESIHQTSQELYDLGRNTPPVRIGIPPLLSTVFFPGLFTDFRAVHPEIPLELFEYGSVRSSSLVQKETLDLALVNLNFYETDKMNSFYLRTEPLVFCVSDQHPLAQEKEITIEMLRGEPLIMYNTDSVLNNALNARFEHAGFKPNVILHASQLYTIQSFIHAGIGGAVLYHSLIRDVPGLSVIPIVPAIEQEIGFVWKKGKYLNGSVRRFIDFLKKQ